MGRSAARSPPATSSAAPRVARGRSCNQGCPPAQSSPRSRPARSTPPFREAAGDRQITSQGIFRSGDGGITWTAGTGVPQALTLTVVQFGPLDPNLAYAGADAGGSSGGDFYRSTDGGLTYHKADTGLPSGRRNVEAIAIANTTPPEVVVALNPPTGGSQIYIESDLTRRYRRRWSPRRRKLRCRHRCPRHSPRRRRCPRRSNRRRRHRLPAASSASRKPPSTGRPRWSTRSSSCSWRCTSTSGGGSAYYVEGPP